jgi:UTP--glucose-1-phosphate uridylyltransferase
MIKKAIIPAAGYGTRSLPITKVLPKEMFPIGVKPAIHYVVEEAAESGIEQVLVIVSRTKSLIVDYFDHSLELEAFLEKENKSHLMNDLSIPNIQILYTRQPYARGLGDAIRLGKNFVGDDSFAILLPDDIIISKEKPALKQLIEVYKLKKSSVIGLNKVEDDLLQNYGVVKGQKEKNRILQIKDVVEKPKTNPPSNLAIIGRYVFTSDIFNYLEKLKPGVGGEYQLTDAIKEMLDSRQVLGKVMDGKRYDIGKSDEYIDLLNLIYKEDK